MDIIGIRVVIYAVYANGDGRYMTLTVNTIATNDISIDMLEIQAQVESGQWVGPNRSGQSIALADVVDASIVQGGFPQPSIYLY